MANPVRRQSLVVGELPSGEDQPELLHRRALELPQHVLDLERRGHLRVDRPQRLLPPAYRLDEHCDPHSYRGGRARHRGWLRLRLRRRGRRQRRGERLWHGHGRAGVEEHGPASDRVQVRHSREVVRVGQRKMGARAHLLLDLVANVAASQRGCGRAVFKIQAARAAGRVSEHHVQAVVVRCRWRCLLIRRDRRSPPFRSGVSRLRARGIPRPLRFDLEVRHQPRRGRWRAGGESRLVGCTVVSNGRVSRVDRAFVFVLMFMRCAEEGRGWLDAAIKMRETDACC
mmetsp:Transcript_49356/g.139759  ORF Transcript_49356/g.139759 Transcript_49356/m.139759 type:complete len:285 (-) Transcript_49356:100-954(-)